MSHQSVDESYSVQLTKEERRYLEFYLTWSTKRLFGDSRGHGNERHLYRSILRKVRTAVAEIDARTKADIATLERMLGTGEKEAQS